MTFGIPTPFRTQAIVELLDAKGMTPNKLSVNAGFTQTYISRVVKGTQRINDDSLVKVLVMGFGISRKEAKLKLRDIKNLEAGQQELNRIEDITHSLRMNYILEGGGIILFPKLQESGVMIFFTHDFSSAKVFITTPDNPDPVRLQTCFAQINNEFPKLALEPIEEIIDAVINFLSSKHAFYRDGGKNEIDKVFSEIRRLSTSPGYFYAEYIKSKEKLIEKNQEREQLWNIALKEINKVFSKRKGLIQQFVDNYDPQKVSELLRK